MSGGGRRSRSPPPSPSSPSSSTPGPIAVSTRPGRRCTTRRPSARRSIRARTRPSTGWSCSRRSGSRSPRCSRPRRAGSACLAAAVAVGVGFPAVLIEDTHALVLGAVALAAVLWASVVQGAGDTARAARGLAVGAGLVVAVGAIATAGLTPTAAHVDWRGWDPFADGGRTANVAYVWDAHYGGIEFPARPTVVLRVRAPKRAEYWRVSTLETFADDRWIENLYPVDLAGPRRRLPDDPLVPRRDARPGAWLRQRRHGRGARGEQDRRRVPARPDRRQLRPRALPRRRDHARRPPAPARRPSTRSGATRRARRRGRSRRHRPATRTPRSASSSSGAPGCRATGCRAASGPSIASSPTTATSRSSRTGRSGRRRGAGRRAPARRTRRRCCSSAGSGGTGTSATRSCRRRARARRSSTSSSGRVPATASTTRARWR